MKHRLWLASTCLLAVAITVRVAGEIPSSPYKRSAFAGAAGASRAGAGGSAGAGYAGSDTCLTCHTDQGDTLKGTAHAKAKNPRSPAATQGCESCHGPGQAHVDDDAKGHILSSHR